MTRPLRALLACLAVAAWLQGCGFLVVHGVREGYKAYTKQEREVDAALARYRALVLAMQWDKVADLFDADAELSHDDQPPIVGRPAVSAFLGSFAAYKVLDYALDATRTTASGDSATQKGSYRQVVVPPQGDALTVQGSFDARWSRQADGRWLISRLHTAAGAALHASP